MAARALAAVAVVAALLPASPATQAGTPVIASPNVTLLATIPDPGAVGGHFHTSGGHRWFLTTGASGVRAYLADDPALPVLAGILPFPHYENEDVDICGDLLLVAVDPAFAVYGGLVIVDLSQLPVMTFRYVNPATGNRWRTAPPTHVSFNYSQSSYPGGHTATFVSDDCRWVYAAAPGGAADPIYVIDLGPPGPAQGTNPQLAAHIDSCFGPRDDRGRCLGTGVDGVHDFNRDPAGVVWVVGNEGFAALDVSNPTNPRVIVFHDTRHDPLPIGFNHNSLRPGAGDTLLLTNEDYLSPACQGQGRFATARVAGLGTPQQDVRILDRWTPDLGQTTTAGTQLDGNNAVPPVICSAHWFDERRGLVAIGWYQQGLRILDVSDPAHIRQVGYLLTPQSVTWAARWASDDIVYALDHANGLVVARVDATPGASPSVSSPRLPYERLPAAAVAPSPALGYACAIPRS